MDKFATHTKVVVVTDSGDTEAGFMDDSDPDTLQIVLLSKTCGRYVETDARFHVVDASVSAMV